MSALVRVRRVSKEYASAAGPVRALSEVSLAVERGIVCSIAGPSGSGKTTLLGLIAGLDRPSSGEVWVAGTEIGAMPPQRRARFRLANVGFVFQSNHLIPVLTAAENVALPLALGRLSTNERRRRVDELIDALGLHDAAHRRPAELSGGQQQRVGIARALVTNPQLVLADEPTAHLDGATALGVMAAMRALNAQRGTTLVFSTHDPAVEALATERYAMRSGRIVPAQHEDWDPWQSCSSSPSAMSFATVDGR